MAKILVDDFIRIWQESYSIAEVSAKSGLKIGAANVKAAKLRKQGYELKHMALARKEREASASDHGN